CKSKVCMPISSPGLFHSIYVALQRPILAMPFRYIDAVHSIVLTQVKESGVTEMMSLAAGRFAQ
ncbi:hypothetical protein, partial [Delftia acidovorans]|uniref:hypothetical protein n=1 Tax=Delftia acidovorans TaxID=80866 RepID=UPI0035A05ED0